MRRRPKPGFLLVARREWRWLLHDRAALILIFGVPLFAFAILTAVFSHPVIRDLGVVVVDADRSETSRAFAEEVAASSGLSIVERSGDLASAARAIRSGDAIGAVYVPSWICLPSSHRNISLYSGFKSHRIGAPFDFVAPTCTHSFLQSSGRRNKGLLVAESTTVRAPAAFAAVHMQPAHARRISRDTLLRFSGRAQPLVSVIWPHPSHPYSGDTMLICSFQHPPTVWRHDPPAMQTSALRPACAALLPSAAGSL